MGDVQIIRTASGEELVVLPREEYEALLAAAADAEEDAADVAVYDARKAALTGEADLLPVPVGDLLLKGHTRLKAIRLWRGLAQRDVASRAGLAQGYLSDIENGRKAGAAETLARLARTLDIPEVWIR